MPDARRAFGDRGEDVAAALLLARGVAVVARNARTRLGELDLVGRDAQGWVFVEVKTRRSTSFVSAAEAVDRRKLARLAVLAESWLALQGQRSAPWRLVVLALTVGPAGTRAEWIEAG